MQGIKTYRAYINGWYEGKLQTIFFAKEPTQDIKRQICTVLAGYAWDKTNPYVRDPERAISALAHILGYRPPVAAA